LIFFDLDWKERFYSFVYFSFFLIGCWIVGLKFRQLIRSGEPQYKLSYWLLDSGPKIRQPIRGGEPKYKLSYWLLDSGPKIRQPIRGRESKYKLSYWLLDRGP